MIPDMPIDQAAERLGVDFTDRDLLERALTHPSRGTDNGGPDYERLEFLGDAVLGLIVSEYVYAQYPHLPEGELTRMRTSVVRGAALAEAARAIGLQDVIRLGKGAHHAGEQLRTSVLAAAFEALLAAVYLDSGREAATELVLRALGDRLDPSVLARPPLDPKTDLQELTQARGMGLPEYIGHSHMGPPHDRTFTVEVAVSGEVLGRGSGRTKQAAEKKAAAAALKVLRPGP